MKTLTTLVFGLVALLPSAFADTLLAPGSGQTPATDLVTTGLAPLATITGTFSDSTIQGSYTETVYSDPNTTLACPAGGCLDFILQITNTASGFPLEPVESVTTDNFGGFTVNAGVVAGSGGLIPVSVGRASDGETIIFDYHYSGVGFGQSSAELDIQTNATSYTTSVLSFQDGSATSDPGYMPATGLPGGNESPTPEPGTYGLIGSGLTGLGVLRFRGRKLFKKENNESN